MRISICTGLVVLGLLAGCSKQGAKAGGAPTVDPAIEELIAREQAAAAPRKPSADLTKLRSIEFVVDLTPEQQKEMGEKTMPWISIEKPEPELARLQGADDVVLEHDNVIVVISYPLAKPVEFPLGGRSKKQFTRAEVITALSALYHAIYDEEEKTATVKTVPMAERKMLNRNTTDGKYGIWGHDLGDLDLSSIDVYERKDGALVLILNIES